MHSKKYKKPTFTKTSTTNSKPKFQEKKRNFANLVEEAATQITGKSYNTQDVDGLAIYTYESELEIKNEALLQFWKLNRLPLLPKKIIASPMPRHYRTTTKRLVLPSGKNFYLVFNNRKLPLGNHFVVSSILEPIEHGAIYNLIAEKLNIAAYRLLAQQLNYVIVRGNYTEFSVIFNVLGLSAELIRKLKNICDHLTQLPFPVVSSFIYVDETGSEYYLESQRPATGMSFKKLFGKDKLFVSYRDRKFLYHPTSFSQINQSIIPLMIDYVESILKPNKQTRLLDLYCGYGLFSHLLSEQFGETVGMDLEGSSIQSARDNSAYFKPDKSTVFISKPITPNNLKQFLPKTFLKREVVILDPPKMGTYEGVIEWVAEKKPNRVVHIFCGVDQIPNEVRRWKQSGYLVEFIQPFDMFPGSANLEVVILLHSNESK